MYVNKISNVQLYSHFGAVFQIEPCEFSRTPLADDSPSHCESNDLITCKTVRHSPQNAYRSATEWKKKSAFIVHVDVFQRFLFYILMYEPKSYP